MNDIVKKSEITFLEGYLWDEGDPKKAFDKAISIIQIKLLCHYLIYFVLKDTKSIF